MSLKFILKKFFLKLFRRGYLTTNSSLDRYVSKISRRSSFFNNIFNNSPALWTLNITHPEDWLMLIVSRSFCSQCPTFILLKFGFSCVVHVIGIDHVKFVGVDLRFLRRKRCCCKVTTPFLMATVTTGNPGCSVHVVMIGATDTLYGGFWRRLTSFCNASQRFSGFATLACLLLQRI